MNTSLAGAQTFLAIKASDGFYRIFWGRAGNGTLTFAKPFKDTNYSIAFADTAYYKYDSRYITNKTTTGVTINYATSAVQYIAIGLSA